MANHNDISWLVEVSELYFLCCAVISVKPLDQICFIVCLLLNQYTSLVLRKMVFLLHVVLSVCSHWYYKDGSSSPRRGYCTSEACWIWKRYQHFHHFVVTQYYDNNKFNFVCAIWDTLFTLKLIFLPGIVWYHWQCCMRWSVGHKNQHESKSM